MRSISSCHRGLLPGAIRIPPFLTPKSLVSSGVASTPPLVVVALARFSGLSNGHELSILDDTTFSVVARATVDLAGEVAISTGSIGVRHYRVSPPVNLAAGTQYLLMSSGR